MGVEYQDTFTETSDTNLVSHTPDTGTGWTVPYDPDTSVPKVNSTADVCQVTTSNNGSGCLALATVTLSGNEYDVESDVTTDAVGDDRWGLVGRATDEDNLYSGGGSNNNGSYMYKRVAGVETELARNTGATYDVVSGFTYKLEIRNATKKWYGKGVEWLSSSDNAITATGSGGLFWGNVVGIAHADVATTWQLDNFKITTVSGATTYTKTASLGALIQAQDELKTASMGGLLQKQGLTETASMGALLQSVELLSAQLGGVLKVEGVTVTASAGGLLEKQGVTVDASLNALLRKVETTTAQLGALLQATVTPTAEMDALLQATVTAIAQADALLQEQGVEVQSNLNAVLVKNVTATASLDALLKAQAMLTASMDAILSTGEEPDVPRYAGFLANVARLKTR